MNRRHFLFQTLAGAAVVNTGFSAADAPPLGIQQGGHARPASIEPSLTAHFVSAAHSDLPQVKALLTQEPKLIFATYDWGAGDWETALGAAAHMGDRPIAEYLLSQGARIDAFCAAMMGMTEVVVSLCRASPWTARAHGPHRYSLMYHIGYSGDIVMAESVAPHHEPKPRFQPGGTYGDEGRAQRIASVASQKGCH